MYLGPYYVLVKTLSRPPNDQAALTGQSELCMPVPSRVCLHVAYVCPFDDHTGGISDACAISCDHLPHWHDQSLLAADIMKGVRVCLPVVELQSQARKAAYPTSLSTAAQLTMGRRPGCKK